MSPLTFVRRRAALTAWQNAERVYDAAASAMGSALSRLVTMAAFALTALGCSGPLWLVLGFAATVFLCAVRMVTTALRFLRAAKAEQIAAAAHEDARRRPVANEHRFGGAA